MATPKIFCVNDNTNGKSFLIRAMKPASALALVVGDQYKTEPATPERLYELARNGAELHEASVAAGTKKAAFFTVSNESVQNSVILIRATSSADAVARVAGSAMTIAVAEPERLVQLTKQGVEVMDAKDIPAPPPAADTNGLNSAAANDGANGSGENAGSDNDDANKENDRAAA